MAQAVCWLGRSRAVGRGPGSGDAGRPVGRPGPGWASSVDGTISTPSVATGLAGTCSAAVLALLGGLPGLGMVSACVDWGISVPLVIFVITGVSKASWDFEEIGALEVAAGEATGLGEGPAGNSRLGKACKGVVLTSNEPGPGTVTALVTSGKRGVAGDLEETVMLGLPAKVAVTLVVSKAPKPMSGVSICCERGRAEDAGAWGVVCWLAGTSVGWAGRLDAVTPSGCCRVTWVEPGGSTGPSVVAMDGLGATVSAAARVSAGLWEGAPGVSCGTCSSWSLVVGSS